MKKMVQEIITYMIVGSAATLAVLKVVKKFSAGESKTNADSENEHGTMKHHCTDCPAECVLRDATSDVIQSNQELCKKVESKSN